MNIQTVLHFAEDELKKYCNKMDAIEQPCIQLEVDTSICPAGKEPALDDTYAIDVKKGHGVIRGCNARSVLLGVYAFLRKSGCRFIRPGIYGELIPSVRVDQLSVQALESADHRYRGFCIEGAVSRENVADIIDWAPKMGFNLYFIQFREAHVFFEEWYQHVFNEFLPSEAYSVEDSRAIVQELGAEITRRGMQYHAVGHGWTCESIGYSSTGWHHADNNTIPEHIRPLLAEVNGKREFFGGIPINTHLCYSNPAVRDKIVSEVIRYARQYPEKEYLHFWLADNIKNECECEACQKVRPAEFYVQMLNQMDEQLTALGLTTKIVFIIAYDLLWVPLRERIQNPNRFLLMLAPITRTYRKSYVENGKSISKETGITHVPYVRNQLQLPKDAEETFRFLLDWQKQFPGDCFVFEYHMMWDIHKDYAQMHLSKVLFRDIELLQEFGLNGYISCQLTRSAFPSGFCNYMLGRKLFDRSLSYEEIESEFFEAAYGEQWETARAFLWDISNGFNWAYNRGELPIHHEDTAALLKGTPAKLYAYQETLRNRIAAEPQSCRKKMWEFLWEASEVYSELALVLYNKASGLPTEQVKAQFELFRANLCKRETKLQQVFDLCSFILIVNTIITKEDNEEIAFDEKA